MTEFSTTITLSAADNLLPACGGAESPFTINGRRWLYCYHRASGRHCYLDLDTDRPVWNRDFHPAFHPEYEFAGEVLNPSLNKPIVIQGEPADLYF